MVWFLSKWPQQSTRTCSEHRTCTWQVLLRGHLTFDLQRPTDLGPEEAEPLDQVCEGCELLPRADSIDQRLCSNATLWRLDPNRLRRGGKYRPVSNKAELYDPRPYLLLGEGLREKTVINWNKRPFNNSSLQFGSVPDPGLAALWAELHDRFLFTNKQLRKMFSGWDPEPDLNLSLFVSASTCKPRLSLWLLPPHLIAHLVHRILFRVCWYLGPDDEAQSCVCVLHHLLCCQATPLLISTITRGRIDIKTSDKCRDPDLRPAEQFLL